MSGGEGKVVCVTGVPGYTASWLVKHLLERGYTVRATVRNLSDPKNSAHLKKLEGAEERLRFFEVDLLEEGSLDSVVDGCHGVFYIAPHVLSLITNNPKAESREAGEKVTLDILRSCSKARSVRRVVVNSCIAKVLANRYPVGPEVVVDALRFSDPFYAENKHWHELSKTLAEQAAWKFAREDGLDLVVLHPGHILGPHIHQALNPLSMALLDIIKGTKSMPSYPIVDIRDVALANSMAFENPSASGRYYLVAKTLSHSELGQILHELYPSITVPGGTATGDVIFQVPKQKAENLGVTFMPVEVTLKDVIESLKEKSLFNL